MQEQQITIDWETMRLPRPFIIMATQNPIELEGTFPLPEAQLDRFLLKVKLGYPSKEEEASVLVRFQQDNPMDALHSIIKIHELLEYELQFSSSTNYENPIQDVRSFEVTFTSPSGNKKTINGFWDGGTTWKARFMPDETGNLEL